MARQELGCKYRAVGEGTITPVCACVCASVCLCNGLCNGGKPRTEGHGSKRFKAGGQNIAKMSAQERKITPTFTLSTSCCLSLFLLLFKP